jgi:ATP-dependent DNA ligase
MLNGNRSSEGCPRNLAYLSRHHVSVAYAGRPPSLIRLCRTLPTNEGNAPAEHACRLGLEGIVSKRLDAPYRSGLVQGLA